MTMPVLETTDAGPTFPASPLSGIERQIKVMPSDSLICSMWDDKVDQRFCICRYGMTTFWGSAGAPGTPLLFKKRTGDDARVLFNEGPTDSPNAENGIGEVSKAGTNEIVTPLKLTQAETNCNAQGAWARTEGYYLAEAYGIAFQSPTLYESDGSVTIDTASLYYAPRAIRTLYWLCTIQHKYEDDKCFLEDGQVMQYPDFAQCAGTGGSGLNDIVTSSNPFPGTVVPLMYAYFASGRNSSNQVNVLIVQNRDFNVDSDTTMGGGTTEDQVLQIPLIFRVYGTQWCPAALRQAGVTLAA